MATVTGIVLRAREQYPSLTRESPHGTLAHCPQGILHRGRERKVGASSLLRNHHQRQPDRGQRREKGSPPPSEQRELLNQPANQRALLSPPSSPSLQLSGAHSPPPPPSPTQPLFCNPSRRKRQQRSKTFGKSAGIMVVVGPMMSGYEKGLPYMMSTKYLLYLPTVHLQIYCTYFLFLWTSYVKAPK